MSEIEKLIGERKAPRPKAWAAFEEHYRPYAIGLLRAGQRKNGRVNTSHWNGLKCVRKSFS
jgi:hypothetical protein